MAHNICLTHSIFQIFPTMDFSKKSAMCEFVVSKNAGLYPSAANNLTEKWEMLVSTNLF